MSEPIKMLISIVERGRGSAIMKLYTQRQVFLHCQCPGTGTATSDILNILGLGSSEKDVIISYAAAGAAGQLLTDLDTDLRGAAKTAGIVFMLPLTGINNLVASIIQYKTDPVKPDKKGEEKMEQSDSSLILVVCNRGCTDAVMATAKAAAKFLELPLYQYLGGVHAKGHGQQQGHAHGGGQAGQRADTDAGQHTDGHIQKDHRG